MICLPTTTKQWGTDPTCWPKLMSSDVDDKLGTSAASGWDPTRATKQEPGAPGRNAS